MLARCSHLMFRLCATTILLALQFGSGSAKMQLQL
jgi:hypothetical protein